MSLSSRGVFSLVDLSVATRAPGNVFLRRDRSSDAASSQVAGGVQVSSMLGVTVVQEEDAERVQDWKLFLVQVCLFTIIIYTFATLPRPSPCISSVLLCATEGSAIATCPASGESLSVSERHATSAKCHASLLVCRSSARQGRCGGPSTAGASSLPPVNPSLCAPSPHAALPANPHCSCKPWHRYGALCSYLVIAL